MNTSILEQELAPLNAQIEQVQQNRQALEGELRLVEAEMEAFSAERQRYDALREVCDALDKLGDLKADRLFWEGIPEAGDAAGHVERLRGRIAGFEGEIGDVLAKQATLQEQIDQRLDQLGTLYEEVRDAHDREERRKEEFVVEREISTLAPRVLIMPWTREVESERRLRRALLVALLLCLFFGSLIPMISVPLPDRSVAVVNIPKRLVKLVREQPPPAPRPAPLPKPEPKKPPEEVQLAKREPEKPPEKPRKPPAKPQKPPADPKPQTKPREPAKAPPASEPPKVAGGSEAPAAKKKAEHVGILAFRDAFADLMKETPVAKLGTEARLKKESPRAAGRPVAQRSLVAIQAQGGSSGGIGNAAVSRNIGTGNADRLGSAGVGIGVGDGNGAGFARIDSSIAGLEESSRPLSDGVAMGRTDEEIQIVFDRHKAALYRIYNRELRKDPTLRGKILLRISIETGGEVSLCRVESTDLASPELVARIVERIAKFNFGPKEGVPKMTILYPIDFLPAA